ncbi:MAG: DUF5906 domain-containing protein [Halanaerobiales bacterium]|nr:DUF5906 domain-containing protein [Halanaerobiales bacterium]
MREKSIKLSEIKQQIKKQLDIKEIIEFYTGQQFKNNKILCPFHQEKTASFSVNENKQLYKCFGCSASGDIFTFVEDYLNLEFIEAIETLADDFNLNINLKSYSEKELKEIQDQRKEKNIIKDIYKTALNYFQENMKDEHIDFINKKYGLSAGTIKKAKIGFCPGGLLDHLKSQGYSEKDIYKTGLITKKEGQFKDMYYKRIMIPYLKNGIRYFTGRSTKKNDSLKYLNLKHTSKYIKNPLYYARLKGTDLLILVEGEFDALAAAEMTEHDVIALGKAGLSKQKKKELFKLVKKYEFVIIINDSDENKAGQTGAIKTAEAILRGTGVISGIGQLDKIASQESTDIADYNKKNKELQPVIDKATEFIEVLIKDIAKARNGREAIKKVKELYTTLALIERDYRGYYIDLIRETISNVRGCNKSTLKKSDIEKSVREVKEEHKDEDFNKNWFEYKQNGSVKFRPAILANYYLKKENYITLADNIFKYKNGYFQTEAEREINKNMMKTNILGDEWESFRADSVIDYIKRATKENPVKLLNQSDCDNLINVKNGMINLDTIQFDKENNMNYRAIELLEHDPRYKSFSQLKAGFKPGVECKKLDETIKDILLDEEDPDLNKIKVFWEFIGWIIFNGEIELKKALLMVGSGENGKTVLLNFLTELLGRENIAAVGLYDLVNNDYAASDLFGKKANLAGEMTNNIIKDIEIFKKLTGGDLIRADQKYKEPLEFRNKAKLIFALNTLPKIVDYEEAFFNRLLILRTPNTFKKNSKKYDPQILEKITTKKTLSHGLNKALEGFARLVVNNFKFTQSRKIKEELRKYKAQANTAIPFIEETCNLKAGAVTSKSQLYRIYKDWANENGFGQMSKRKLTSRIKKGFKNLKTTRIRFNGKRDQAWEGLELEAN